jgi:glycosyltransferase involved in cell wall biosynthesis
MCAALNRVPGLRVEIATTDADGAGGRLAPDSLAAAAAPVHLFRRDWSERWKYSRGLGTWLYRHASNYDLLHVHSVWNYPVAAACGAARRAGRPVILRPCGMLSEYSRQRSAWKKALYWRLVERRNLAGVRCFHTTSAGEGGEVRGLGLPGETAVIPLGVDPEAWSREPRPNGLRARCGPPARGRPVVLFLSRLDPKKGLVDLLLPALTRLGQDVFLAIAGGPDEHAPRYADEVREAVGRLGLASRVALLGAAQPAERWELLDGADLFVLPSHSENFGIVVAEAMARAVPVVVSDAVQSCEHVTASGAGRVVPLDVAALAAAIGELLADPSGRKEMGARGQLYAEQRLSWHAAATQIAALYRRCAGGNAPPLARPTQ